MCKHFAYQTLLIDIIFCVGVSIDSPKPDSEQSLKLNLLLLQVLVDSTGSASSRRLLQVHKRHPGNVPLFGRYTNFLFSVSTNEKNSLQRRTQQNKH
jgi:hypothetical protein